LSAETEFSKEANVAILEPETSERLLAVTKTAFTREREPNAPRESAHASRVDDAKDVAQIDSAGLPGPGDRKFLARLEPARVFAIPPESAKFKFSAYWNG